MTPHTGGHANPAVPESAYNQLKRKIVALSRAADAATFPRTLP